MSDTPNIDKTKRAAEVLLGLLQANEVGLHTWHEAVILQIDAIAELSSWKSAADDAYKLFRLSDEPLAREWVRKYEHLRGREVRHFRGPALSPGVVDAAIEDEDGD